MPLEYYRIETDGINGGLLRRLGEIKQTGANSYVCSMQVDDFDEMDRLIRAKGGVMVVPKFAIPGRCWQGYFVDSDQNTFGIFEVDKNAK